MRKEVLLAILAGGALGLIIAFGIWRANAALSPKISPQPLASPTASGASDELGLTLAKPEENEVLGASPITLSGVTKAGAWVGISGEGKDYVVQADQDGAFSADIDLVPAVNEIKVSAFDGAGRSREVSIVVVFSSEFSKQ